MGVGLPTLSFLTTGLTTRCVASSIRLHGLFLFLFLAAISGRAQAPSAPPSALPAQLAADWRATGDVRTLPADAVSVLPDADLYSEFGLLRLHIRSYAKGNERVTIEAFEMKTTAGAYGLFTLHPGARDAAHKDLQQGVYYVRLAGNVDEALLGALRQEIAPDEEGMPTLPSHLPKGAVPGSETYLLGPKGVGRLTGFESLGPALDFTAGADAAAAVYPNGNGQMDLLLLEYHTPQLASDAFAKHEALFNSLPENEKSRRLLKRIGNYIALAIGVQDRPAAQALVDQIKYTPKVYWYGKKLRDIPLDFRPVDPAAAEEAFQTTAIIVRSLYGVVLMLGTAICIGIFAGGAFFLWNRRRRRKLGLDDAFSDAGGSVRLNLDDYLPEADLPEIKQIGNRPADR